MWSLVRVFVWVPLVLSSSAVEPASPLPHRRPKGQEPRPAAVTLSLAEMAKQPEPFPLRKGEPEFPVWSGGKGSKPTPLETLARAAMSAGTRTRAAANGAVQASAETGTRRDAEEAEDAEETTEKAVFEAHIASKQLREAISREQNGLQGTMMSSSAVLHAYEHAQAYVHSLKTVAAGMVDQADIPDTLAPVYKGLQDWKMKVLHDPVQAGRVNGMKEALPFERAMVKIETQVGTLNQKARAFSNAARSMRGTAVQIANAAVGEQQAGDISGAQASMEKAHAMVVRAGEIESEGHRFQEKALEKNLEVPKYVIAARDAVADAMHRVNPEKFPEPPIRLSRPPTVDMLG